MARPLPVAFLSHGSPMLALEEGEWGRALKGWAASMPLPRAILVLSAHWETADLRITASRSPRTLHDYGGFPEELYRLAYSAPGDPPLAARIAALLEKDWLQAHLDEVRGLDHGAWVPLRAAFPEADIPVLQLSLPALRHPASMFELGRALAPLRFEEVLLVASGGVVHNLGRLDWSRHPVTEAWAAGFDAWVEEGVQAMDVPRLLVARNLAPHYEEAVPTSEHFDPLYVALGAAQDSRPRILFEGWQHGNLSLRAWEWA